MPVTLATYSINININTYNDMLIPYNKGQINTQHRSMQSYLCQSLSLHSHLSLPHANLLEFDHLLFGSRCCRQYW